MSIFAGIGWAFAALTLAVAFVFFWRREKFAGLAFVIVFLAILAGVSEKRIVLKSALLGLTFESDKIALGRPERMDEE